MSIAPMPWARLTGIGLLIAYLSTGFPVAVSADDDHQKKTEKSVSSASGSKAHKTHEKQCSFPVVEELKKKRPDRKEKEDEHGHGQEKTEAKGKGKPEKDDHESENIVRLTKDQISEIKVSSERVEPGTVARLLPLTAEIAVNAYAASKLSSSVSGRIVDVRAKLGQRVNRGDVLAVVQSQELAGIVAEYLAARERLRTAESSFKREKSLREKKISSEQAFLSAQEDLGVARITLRSLEDKLRAIGLSDDDLEGLIKGEASAHRYLIEAPLDGTVIRRDAGLGERTDTSKVLFQVADLGTVWVIANVYQNDLSTVKAGQTATVQVGAYKDKSFEGKVTWISDVLEEQTRTLKIRIEVDNDLRLLKPGMFANVAVGIEEIKADLVVPKSAVVRHRGEDIVFVQKGAGEFLRREVSLGLQGNRNIQILKGVTAEECVVTREAFTLKSELDKGEFSGGHGH